MRRRRRDRRDGGTEGLRLPLHSAVPPSLRPSLSLSSRRTPTLKTLVLESRPRSEIFHTNFRSFSNRTIAPPASFISKSTSLILGGPFELNRKSYVLCKPI